MEFQKGDRVTIDWDSLTPKQAENIHEWFNMKVFMSKYMLTHGYAIVNSWDPSGDCYCLTDDKRTDCVFFSSKTLKLFCKNQKKAEI